MKLLTNDLEEKLKEYPLGSQDGKLGNSKVIAKFFNPTGVGTWYIIEGQMFKNICFNMQIIKEMSKVQIIIFLCFENNLYLCLYLKININ